MTHLSEKQQLLADCDHPSDEFCECRRAALVAVLAYWEAMKETLPLIQDAAETGSSRERVELTGRELSTPSSTNLAAEYEQLRPRTDFDLGALAAWMAIGIAISLIVILAGWQLVLWLSAAPIVTR